MIREPALPRHRQETQAHTPRSSYVTFFPAGVISGLLEAVRRGPGRFVDPSGRCLGRESEAEAREEGVRSSDIVRPASQGRLMSGRAGDVFLRERVPDAV